MREIFSQSIGHSVAFCALFGVIAMGGLIYNARIWLGDYPAAIQAAVPPLDAAEKRTRNRFAIFFFVAMLGFIAFVLLRVRALEGGDLSFRGAFLGLFIPLQMVNLFDAVVLDWLILAVMKPKFAILPGAEHLVSEFEDVRFHLVNFAKGVVICTVLPAVFALAAFVV